MTKFTYPRNLSLLVVSMISAIGLAFSYLTQENGGFPHKSELNELQGYVSWVEERDYRISFGLTTHDFDFGAQAIFMAQLIAGSSRGFSTKGLLTQAINGRHFDKYHHTLPFAKINHNLKTAVIMDSVQR